MDYYKVRPEYDKAEIFRPSGSSKSYVSNGVLVQNELYTPIEVMRFNSNACVVRDESGRKTYEMNTEAPCFEKVHVSKNRTYKMFGSRFEMPD